MEMKLSDLGELYILLVMYKQCYDSKTGGAELLAEVEQKYRIRYELYYNKEAPAEIRNPREAGRKPANDPHMAESVCRFHADGKTIREIAQLVNCSVGHVHKLIHEHELGLKK